MIEYSKSEYAETPQKEVSGIKGEFYYANEYNPSTEYKHFPAEIYAVSKEYGKSAKEYADSGAEITNTSKKLSKQKSGSGTLVNKVLDSLKGVAVTSSVAAAAVLGATVIAPPPSVELLNFSVGGNYVEYEMSIEKLQDDLEYFIVVSSSNEPDRNFLIEENGVYQNKVEDLKSEWEYSLTFLSYDETWGETVYFEKTFQTTAFSQAPPDPIIPDYQARITGISVSNLNEIRIEFFSANLDEHCEVELLVSSQADSVAEPILLTTQDLERGYVTVVVTGNSSLISVQPIIKYGADQALQFEVYESSLEASFTADVKVDTVNQKVVFYFKGITGGGTYVNVIDSVTLEEVLKEELYANYVEMYYQTEDPLDYIIFLTDESGEKTTNDFSASVTLTAEEMGEYVFNYKNPGDVGVTYNDDGTINVYIQTDFSTADERLYYQVLLGDLSFRSRESLFVAQGLENTTYPLIYEICYDSGGVQYCINSISVSGAVNEFTAESYIFASLVDNTLQMSISGYRVESVDLNNVRAVSSSGEQIQLSENDFVYDEEYDEYVCSVDFTNAFEYITVYAPYSPFANNMQGIDDYLGSLSFEFSIIVEPDI
ncbi:MAG: hypothetical protein IKA72_00495 [Clostridia bacterium]|nr:hypothetical protein [Clostridia bacterium]